MKSSLWILVGVLITFSLLIMFFGLAACDSCNSENNNQSSNNDDANNSGTNNDDDIIIDNMEDLKDILGSGTEIELPILPYE